MPLTMDSGYESLFEHGNDPALATSPLLAVQVGITKDRQ
jgi:hypothetical protein